MDFWKIVGIVLLISAASGLLVLVRELQVKQKNMQKPAPAKPEKREITKTEEKLHQAAAQQKPQSADEDSDTSWEYEDHTLHIRGQGTLLRCAEWKSFRQEVRHVVIEPGFTAIGEDAFRDFSFLKTVDIPDTLTKIGEHAFHYCRKLERVVLPDGLLAVGQNAFSGCSSVCITLPESIREIGWEAFKDVPDVLYHGEPHIILTHGKNRWETVPRYESMHFQYVIGCRDKLFGTYIDPSGGLIDVYKPEIVYPEGVVITRYNGGEMDVTIPAFLDGHPVVGIGAYAFAGLPVLRSVTIEAQILRIGAGAFFSCMDLESVQFPESLEMIDSEAFHNTALTELKLPTKLRKIGADAFGKTKIRELILPESLEILGDDAFMECEQLEKVSIPKGIECFVDAQQETGWPMDRIYEQFGPALDAHGEPMSDTGSIHTFAYCPRLTQVEDHYGLNQWQMNMLFEDTPRLAAQNAETGDQS